MAETETESTEVDPTVYLDKPATALQERFAIWIKEYVGYNPAAAKTKEEAFQAGVRIATATRMVFQASDFNRQANAEQRAANEAARAERAAAAEAEPKPVPAKAAPAKKAAAKKASPAKVAPVATTPAEAPKPVRKPARRTAPAAAATAEAPF